MRGTLFRLLESWPEPRSTGTCSAHPGRGQREARRSAAAWLRAARKSHVDILEFRESYFPDQWADIKDRMEQIRASCEPDLIFTHSRDDLHQDHRVVSELTWNAFRHHTILEYEIPKYDGDIGNPNLYATLSRRRVPSKGGCPHAPLPEPDDKALVHRGHVLRAAPPPRH